MASSVRLYYISKLNLVSGTECFPVTSTVRLIAMLEDLEDRNAIKPQERRLSTLVTDAYSCGVFYPQTTMSKRIYNIGHRDGLAEYLEVVMLWESVCS